MVRIAASSEIAPPQSASMQRTSRKASSAATHCDARQSDRDYAD